MNCTLLLAAISLTACKSRETTEVTVTTETPGAKVTAGSGAPTLDPGKLTRARLEKSLRKRLAEDGFTTFTCPEAGSADTETSCTAAGDNGTKVTVKVTRDKVDPDGSWASWTSNLDIRVISTEELAEKIHDGVMAAVKKAHPKATAELACGTSPIVFADHKATCKLTMHKPDKVVDITIDDSKDAFDWSADAF